VCSHPAGKDELYPRQPYTVVRKPGEFEDPPGVGHVHRGEAELFLTGLVVSGEGWRVRRTAAGELISVLMGPCAGVGRILLDPLPALATAAAADLVGVGREDFLDLLLS
jgi:hypothetical protein